MCGAKLMIWYFGIWKYFYNKTEVTSVKLVLFKYVMSFATWWVKQMQGGRGVCVCHQLHENSVIGSDLET